MLRPLFGGALSCDIPESFADVSSFRQVPDNQEVFANAATDQSVIIELLQYEKNVSDTESGRYFFNELAQSNGCGPDEVTVLLQETEEVQHMSNVSIDAPHTTQLIVGDQHVAKFKEDDAAKNVVRVYLGNVRLPGVTTDVILTVSTPMQISSSSSSRDACHVEHSSSVAAAIFKQALQTLVIVDWSLFQ
uniref:Ran guanine nucleotide release factor n=1 Tax=Peronospora matthiolae TaxID=2874970 RepID=A0AAV1VLV4_9STRA